jgi:NAD(P)-dependent dehydrogenase (short-subunit alcohol dehydrogenase family)
MRCEGKIVLVTSAQRGIGRAVVLRFAQEGADVVLNFLDDQPTQEAQAELARRIPTGRLAEPEDIADVIGFLATDDARHIIGQLMHVNGGDYLA